MLPLVVDVAADGDLDMLREGKFEIDAVTLTNRPVAVAGVIDGEVEERGVVFVVEDHVVACLYFCAFRLSPLTPKRRTAYP